MIAPVTLSYIFVKWVRKLTGRPGGHTSPDREFDARRIHRTGNDYATAFSCAAESKVFRIHSDVLCRDLATATRMALCSRGDTRACRRMPRRFSLGILGLPIFALIKHLVYYKNNC